MGHDDWGVVPEEPGSNGVSQTRVRLSTTAGDIVISLATREAPFTTAAFLCLLDEGQLTSVRFLRVVRQESDHGQPCIDVIQTMPIDIESGQRLMYHESTAVTGLRHKDGAVSLARSVTAGSIPGAFFICIGDQPGLDHGGARIADGLGFAVFGEVISGMDVVRAIHERETIMESPDPYLRGQILKSPVDILSARRESAAATELLRALAEDYWHYRLREHPEEVSIGGYTHAMSTMGGGAPVDHERRLVLAQAMLARAHAIVPAQLSEQDAISLQLLVEQLSRITEGWRCGDHLAPKLYPFGFTEIPAYLIGSTPLATRQDFERFVSLLQSIPSYFGGHLETLQLAHSIGYRMPRVLASRLRGLLAAQLAEDGFAAAVRARFAEPTVDIDPETLSLLSDVAGEMVETRVLPALREMLRFLDDTGDDFLRETISICDQPDGAEYYRFRVRQQTSMDLDPEKIHEIGLNEVVKLQSELHRLLEEVGCDAPAYASRLATEGIFTSADALRERVCVVAKNIDGVLPKAFGRLPRVTYDVRSFTIDQSHHRPIAMAQMAPADRSLPGVFWITALPERCPAHLLVSLTLHEAWPGHLMQFAIAQEQHDLPHFRRHSFLEYNAYIEGWALYCERLGYDLGLYRDPRDRFGQLGNDLWRAARLVVDTGIHWKGWSRDQAIEYLIDTAYLPRATAEVEIDRYIGMPAQALSYKIGELTISRLRAEASARLGDAFSLREFHDAVLAIGPVSLPLLEQAVSSWVKGTIERC